MNEPPVTEASLELLYKKNYRSLCMVSYSFVKDMDAAKDIVQEFFIKYWEKYKNIKPPEKFEAYAFIAVKNKSLNYISSSGIREKRELSLRNTFYEDEQNQPEEDQRHSFRIKVMKAIGELPDQRRKIFIMSAIEGKKYAEIASQLNISINTVKTQIRKAYQYIRNECNTVNGLILFLFLACSHPFFEFIVICIVP